MLIKTNKTKELVESKLGINFEEFKLVGCREISALTLIYEKNNELYVIQIANNIISSISKILSINERDNFSKLFLKNKMVKYKSKFLMIYDFYLNEKDKIFIFNEANDKVYNVYESESPLTLDKTEMTMIKMLGNFIDEEEIEKFKCQWSWSIPKGCKFSHKHFNLKGGKSMLVKKNKAIKIIEEKLNFKFEELKIIGYFKTKFGLSSWDKDENKKTIICKDKKNIFIINLKKDTIFLIKKLNYVSKENGAFSIELGIDNKKFYYDYKEKLALHNTIQSTINIVYVINGVSEVIGSIENELKLSEEESVILKLSNYFIDEEEMNYK